MDDPRPRDTPHASALYPPGAAPRATRIERRKRRRARHRIILIAVAATAAIAAGGVAYSIHWAKSSFDEIPRFPATTLSGKLGDRAALQLPALQAHAPENYLVFSVGSYGLDQSGAERAGIFGGRATMPDKLTDSIMLVVIHPETGKVGILSIPRDTWIPEYGEKINAIYELQGPQAFADTVTRITGQPVNHMIAANFAAFADLTNAINGVDLYGRRPTRDSMSYLDLTHTGCIHFNGATALQFVRSRHTEVQAANGRWHIDPSADDFGRMHRQQDFLQAAARKILTPNGVLEVPDLIRVAQHNLTMDASLTADDAFNLLQSLVTGHGPDITTSTVPGTVGWVGPASVVFVTDADARTAAAELEATISSTTPATSTAPSANSSAPSGNHVRNTRSAPPATGTPCTP
jgi:LCP family protein required for cell wall assembly